MKNSTRRIAFAGILAAAYAAFTIVEGLLVPTLAYGDIQFRFAEAFSVLCCFTPAAIPGMVIGCIVANVFSSVSILDTVIGSCATLLACVITWKLSHRMEKSPWIAWLVPLPTILCNALIVGAEVAYVWYYLEGEAFWASYGLCALFVGIGEAAVMYLLGMPLLLWLRSNKRLSGRLREI